MLEVTHGRAKNQMVANEVRRLLLGMNLDGSLYIGYPVLATADNSVTVDALLNQSQGGMCICGMAEIGKGISLE